MQRELKVIREKAIREVKSQQAGPLYSYLTYTLDNEKRYNKEIVSDVKTMAKRWEETMICKEFSSIINEAGIMDYLFR